MEHKITIDINVNFKEIPSEQSTQKIPRTIIPQINPQDIDPKALASLTNTLGKILNNIQTKPEENKQNGKVEKDC